METQPSTTCRWQPPVVTKPIIQDGWRFLFSSQMSSDDRVLYFPNFHLAPEQPSAGSARFPVVPGNLPDRNDLGTRTQIKGKACICTYENCGKSFSKSSHAIFFTTLGRSPTNGWAPDAHGNFFAQMSSHATWESTLGVTPFKCNHCNMAYGRSGHLQGHIKWCH